MVLDVKERYLCLAKMNLEKISYWNSESTLTVWTPGLTRTFEQVSVILPIACGEACFVVIAIFRAKPKLCFKEIGTSLVVFTTVVSTGT